MKKLSFLFAALVAVFSANSEVLVYDGFASSAYTIGSGGTGTLNGYPKVYNDTMIGFSEKTWQMNGSQPKVWGYGLNLPSTFAAVGIVTKGEWSIGPNGGGSQKRNRDTSRDLTSKLLNKTSGSLYFRVLMHLDKTAAAMLPTTSDTLIEGSDVDVNYWGVGFSPEWGTSYSMLNTAKGAFGFFFRKNKAGAVALIFRGKGADGTKLERELCAVPAANTGLRDDNTYIAYAQIDINAGTDGGDVIFAGAQNIMAYSATEAGEVFSQSIGELDIFNDTVYPNTLVFDGCYQTNGKVLFDEIGVATEATDLIDITFAGNPKISDIVASGHSGAYSVAATIIRATATDAGAIVHDGANAFLHSYGAVDEGADFTKDFSLPTPADDKTYRLGAYAVNGEGGVTNFAATAYNGVLTLTKVKDADEYGLSAGEVTVSRVNADPFPIDVAYAFSSDDGTAGKTWENPTGPVTIPAGETSATIYLKPRLDVDVDKDIEVTVSLEPGNYLAGTTPVILVLKTVAPPAGYNTWMAMSDGLASDAANWSLKHAPTADDDVLFDGNFSKANCEWDAGENGPSATIASLTSRGGFTGKIVIDTVYSGTFETFSITGNMDLQCGMLSQKINDTSTADTYRLRISVGGDLTVGADAKIDVSGCGPATTDEKSQAYAADMSSIGTTWGDPKLPTACGKAGKNKSKAGGGGAIYLTVAGKTTLDGSVLADGIQTISTYATSYNGWGCGGSIYLETGSFEGAGVVSASTPLYVKGDNSRGTSGRISVWSKTTVSAFPVDNLRAWGDRQETDYNIGAGTVVVRNPGEANGTLYIRNNPDRNFSYNVTVPQQTQTTSIPKGDTWTFDAVVLGNYGVLTIPDTAKLVLPNGFASVSCLNTETATLTKNIARTWHCGLIVRDGGAVEAPAQNGKHEFKGGRWTFCPCSTYTLTGDVEVSGGANIGVPLICQGMSNFITCNVKVIGDMDVKADGFVSAEYGGLGGNTTFSKQGYVAFPDGDGNMSSGTGHGGQKATASGNNSYDSFFMPQLPGAAGGHADVRNMGGGVINLEVTGMLNVDGKITSSAVSFGADNHAGGAGSLNVRAGTLTGAGGICANTTPSFSDYAKSGYGSSGGGRVAVRLADSGATFSDYWLANITAKGYSKVGSVPKGMTNDDQRYSSAGSVYLQTAAESEKCGTIVIRNDGVAENTAWTSLPAAAETDAVADFKKASLSLLDCGKVRLYETLQMANLTLAENCKLDLNGKTLTVNTARFGGTKLKPGTYVAGDAALGDFVTDSVGGGSLVVKGTGMMLLVR